VIQSMDIPGSAALGRENDGMARGGERVVSFGVWPPVAIGAPWLVGSLLTTSWGTRSTSRADGFPWAGRSCCSSSRGTAGRCGCSAGTGPVYCGDRRPRRWSRRVRIGSRGTHRTSGCWRCIEASRSSRRRRGVSSYFRQRSCSCIGGAIRPEERFVHQRFGAAYDDYTRRARRWVTSDRLGCIHDRRTELRR
jgi:hypothetical protein